MAAAAAAKVCAQPLGSSGAGRAGAASSASAKAAGKTSPMKAIKATTKRLNTAAPCSCPLWVDRAGKKVQNCETWNSVCALNPRPNNRGTTIMPALLPIVLTASYVVLAADRVPELNVDPG